ncbi:MAG: dihydroorotase [Oscillospiraceae bacterium]|jgi:dihydroorotase|nr:dihydroorotase [Oscillospiraceae bacterium]
MKALPQDIAKAFDCAGLTVFPGFVDLHAHFREPGFESKETIATGSRAAARGGYTTVCTMPNLNPAPDTLEHLQIQLDAIERDAVIPVYPVGAITMGQKGHGTLSAMAEIAPHVVGFSDDGVGIRDGDQMREAMRIAAKLDKPIIAHCEVKCLLNGGYIHDGDYCRAHGHKGICAESEWLMIARDLELARQTECRYHVCHVSAKESVALIRTAKRRGVRVTCETAPHYLCLTDDDLQEDGRFKMNPPLRTREDQLALIDGMIDGTIDAVATDHAPHTREDKSNGLAGSAFGIVGLETAFAVLYTGLVRTDRLVLDRLIDLMSNNPRRLLREWMHLPVPQTETDFCLFDLSHTYKIDPNAFASKGRSTPFDGMEVCGSCKAIVQNGKITRF